MRSRVNFSSELMLWQLAVYLWLIDYLACVKWSLDCLLIAQDLGLNASLNKLVPLGEGITSLSLIELADGLSIIASRKHS